MMDYQEPQAVVSYAKPEKLTCGDLLRKLLNGEAYNGQFVIVTHPDGNGVTNFPPAGLNFNRGRVANVEDLFDSRIYHMYFRHNAGSKWDSVLTYELVTGRLLSLYVKRGNKEQRFNMLRKGDDEFVFNPDSVSVLERGFDFSTLTGKIAEFRSICIPNTREYLDFLVEGKLKHKRK